jgi:DNA-binding CsgD family transcriptional regulator
MAPAQGCVVSTRSNIKPGDPLSVREREIAARLIEGDTNEEIGLALGLSRHTVKFHVNHIVFKLDVRNRVQAAVRLARSAIASRCAECGAPIDMPY